MIKHYNHFLFIRIRDINALICQEKLFIPRFFLQSKFIYRKRQTQVLVIISNLFMIRHFDHHFIIRILDIDALVWQEKLFLRPLSFESQFICLARQTWILIKTSFIEIRHYNHFFLIWKQVFDGLAEKLFFPPFSYN